jgi:CRP-like cAMP-binding protein
LFHLGTVLFEVGDECEAVYFLKSGILSLVLVSATGTEVEVGMVGREGVAGMLDVLGGNKAMTRCQVQSAGNGWRLPAEILRQEYERNAPLRQVLLRYQHALTAMAAQNVLCNRLHSVEQRLAKWLLLVQDRVQSDELELTHEFISTMLGTRREAVTIALKPLREAEIISHRRGYVTILDRARLEHLACKCYPVLKQQFQQKGQEST